MDTHTHDITHEWTSQQEQGEASGSEGRRRGGLWEERQEGKKVWSESRGTPDFCYPTFSLNSGWETAAAAGRETQGPESEQPHTHTFKIHIKPLFLDTHMLPWLCHHSNTVTPALQLHSRAWSPAGFWGRGGVNLSIFSWLTVFCAGDNKTFSKVRFTLHQAIQVPCTSTWCELGMNVGKWENEEKAGSNNRGGKRKTIDVN